MGITAQQLRHIAWVRGQYGKNVYHANVPNHKKIGRYVKDFPIRIDLARGTKTAVLRACQKYLGRSYLGMRNYQIVVNKPGTWIYHSGTLYLKRAEDQTIITVAMLTK